MDFSLSDEQRQIQDSVKRYVGDHYGFERRRAILESAEGWSSVVWHDFADLGLLALGIPTDDGGLGGGVLETALVAATLGDVLVVEPYLSSAVLATRALAALGSADQRGRWLPALIDGSLVATLALDLGPGSDGRTRVRARRDGEAWNLDGRVPVSYHAPIAGLHLVAASTRDDGVADALFAVPAACAGLLLQPCTTVDGQRAADLTCAGVRLGDGQRLGGDATEVLAAVVDAGTVALCGEALGVLDRTLALTVEYTRNRSQFGGPIGRFQVLQHRMVDMLTHIEQARSLLWVAASRCDAGPASERSAAVSAAKVLVSEAARYVGQQAVQLHGGMGVSDDMPISHYFKRLAAVELRFGAADVHLDRYLRGFGTEDHAGAALGL
jgi:alkylation response protein AidB-like acyl-CoA dehydrogenase